MDLRNQCPHKLVTAEQAVAKIKTGSRVFIGTGCGEPQRLIHAMVANKALYDILIYQMLSFTLAQYVEDRDFLNRFSLKLFFISRDMRKAAFEGKIDYIPAYLSQIPRMFHSKQIGLDIALIQVTPPDKHGYCSLGVSVDITRAGMSNASVVIAQVNPKMVRTSGDSNVHIDEIDYLVVHDEPLVEYLPDTGRDRRIAERIGHFVSQMIDDGSTLQIGFGSLPGQILQSLINKKDLGVHTQVITDGFLPLLKQKVITCKMKNHLPGRIVGSLCMGSKELYDYVDANPLFYFRSSEYVNDPNVIAGNDKLISISSALEADLTGQVCSDSVGHLFYSGIGDQVDFLRGSAMSKGGFSIIALPSTAQDGQISRIVPFLNEGAGVATTRGDVNYVVTEYGVAALKGKSIYQRVMEMAQIAHPKFREELIEQAKTRHYIFSDQIPPSKDDLLFLEAYKTSHKLRNGKSIELRPIMPSDEFNSRNFFYSLQEKTIFYRYFYKRKIFGHKEVQNELASVDYRQNMTLIGLMVQGGHKTIMAVASYAQEPESNLAEVAFVVGEDFQGLGVASIMMDQLENIARKNGLTGFTAIVLKENNAMQHVFKKRYPNSRIQDNGPEVYFTMMFDGDAKD
ncbi:bifunctional acetyl-CoA hydrolase/transferase family protein/GNAT family N-acetyltransferase [Desulforhopalus singaporensis]|uniref:Acyl-CoA hydrolase n=1 Tax=Desulforhopalus singaporensis TaxID=91360 RepID=A0A1H0VS44_9BACT|nr:bifunctional acetyl-CoA hydrolase/transferase family protein/GNAT family N-acetyltransferase [Desulforhopalus singaporensis]SDP80916.1 Acyl-CoA hydrolase [Desulforhopalus singaporensis]